MAPQEPEIPPNPLPERQFNRNLCQSSLNLLQERQFNRLNLFNQFQNQINRLPEHLFNPVP
jgi:hypothetical protein